MYIHTGCPTRQDISKWSNRGLSTSPAGMRTAGRAVYVALENLDTFRWTAEENPEMDLPPKPDNATTATVIPTNAPEVQGDSQQKDSTGGTPGGAALSQGRRRETVIPKHVVRLFLRSGIEYIYIYMYLTLIFSYDRGGSILCS